MTQHIAAHYRDYLRKLMRTHYRPTREEAISLALRAYELRYGARVMRHAAWLRVALEEAYVREYQAAHAPEHV